MEKVYTKLWMLKAFALLDASLASPRHELNELDWKSDLSLDSKRLAEHLSAFSNYPGGGFMVFGVDNNGIPEGINQLKVATIVNTLSNIGRNTLEPKIAIDFAVEEFKLVSLLFIYVAESPIKPVHIRGKSLDYAFIRSGGSTRQASRQDIGK